MGILPRAVPVHDLVRLLDADPELGDRLTPEDQLRAGHQLGAAVLRGPAGRWDAAGAVEPGGSPLGLVILEGLLLRDLDLGRRASTEVLGFGDILRPWGADAAASELPLAARRTVPEAPPRAI